MGEIQGNARLRHVVHQVRMRWRLKLLLRGLSLTAGAALGLFILLSFVLDTAGFHPATIVALRVIGWGGVLAVAVRWLVLPLRNRPSDREVALYMEEHEPVLQASLLSALEAGDESRVSPALLRRTIETALDRCRTINDGRRIEQRELNTFASIFAGVAVLGTGLLAFNPALLRNGAGALLNPIASVGSANPFRIEVLPGDVTIPRGADQTVRAELFGFMAQDAEIVVRTGSDSSFSRIPMVALQDDSAAFEVLLFQLRDNAEYFVSSGDIRSPVYRITVEDLPYVDAISLEYRFPAYTGLPPEIVEGGGDIAALRGTTAIVRATTTVPVQSGRIVFDNGTSVPLAADSTGTLSAAFRIDRPGFYHLEFAGPNGRAVNGSPQYSIDVLDDNGPSISFSKPGRDTRATNIEEVFLEARANDDYGVSSIELVYSVNGGEQKSIAMYDSENALPEVIAGHTLYLEEMDLNAGDLVTYFARVRDNSAGTPHEATSDIYFISVRPFGRDYRQADAAPPGGGGGGGEQPGDLAETQREIISATFNLERERARLDAAALAERLNTIALSQERLRDQVQALAQRMTNRGVTEDSTFRQIAAILPQAVLEMTAAAAELRAEKTAEALPPEQRALQHVQRAEALYRDVQVSMQQPAGGGGGGGAPNAEDLADLFELELDKLRNQYETAQQGQQEASENQVDETLERLRELARRQEQEIERQRRQSAQQGGQAGGGGASQRQLAEETEQAARQLERLARENNRQDLQETARQMQEAADAMRRQAANARTGNSAQGADALEQLREARRRLERQREQGLQQSAQDARARAQRLAEQQRDIQQDMERLQSATPAQRTEAAQRLLERKQQQAAEVGQLERDLDRMASAARGEQQEASRQMRAAADSIRTEQLKEMILWSRNLTAPSAPRELIDRTEGEIGRQLDQLEERVAEAARALEQGGEQRSAEDALEQARDLVRSLESLGERANEQQQNGRRLQQPGQQGEQGEGEDGEQGEEGQGQQGQQGQGQGQQGQPGQGQPGQGQQGRNGERMTGAPNSGGSQGSVSPGATAAEQRQLRSELRQRIAEAEELRQELLRQGVDAGQLEDVLSSMRSLDRAGLGDPASAARLQREVVEGVKEFEFGLRRALLGTDGEKLRLSGTEDIPEGFRKLVEEYYRSLSRQR